MNKTECGSALAATVLVAGAVTSFANPASAAIVTQVDEIRIEGGGFGFTEDGTDGAGTLTWTETGAEVVPSLHGELVLRGVATECARVRLITYEVGGFGEERFFSDEHCADDNDKQTFTVDLADDDYAIEAKVTVQSKIDDDTWANVEPSRTVRDGPELEPSDFIINCKSSTSEAARSSMAFSPGNRARSPGMSLKGGGSSRGRSARCSPRTPRTSSPGCGPAAWTPTAISSWRRAAWTQRRTPTRTGTSSRTTTSTRSSSTCRSAAIPPSSR